MQVQSVTKVSENVVVLKEIPTTMKDGSNEKQTSGVNSATENSFEMQTSGVNKTVENGVVPEVASIFKDQSNEMQSSGINCEMENSSEMQTSGANETVENAMVPEVAFTFKDQSNEMLSSGVNSAIKNSSEMQTSGANKTTENAMVSEVASTFKDQSNEMLSSGVNSAIKNSSEMQTSGANKTTENAMVPEVASTSKDQSNEMLSSGANSAIENSSEMQTSGVNETVENAMVPEVASTFKDQSNEMLSSGANSAIENSSEMQTLGANKTTENAMVSEVASTFKDQSNEMLFSGVNSAIENSSEMQTSSANETVENAMVPEMQSFGVNRTDKNVTAMQHSSVNKTNAITLVTQEMTLTELDESDKMESTDVERAAKNNTELQHSSMNKVSVVLEQMESSLVDQPHEMPSSKSNVDRTTDSETGIQPCVCVIRSDHSQGKQCSSVNRTLEKATEITIFRPVTTNENYATCKQVEPVSTLIGLSTKINSFGVNMSEEMESLSKRTSDTPMTGSEGLIVSATNTICSLSEETVSMTVSRIPNCCLSEETDSADSNSDCSNDSCISKDNRTSRESASTPIVSLVSLAHDIPVEPTASHVSSECRADISFVSEVSDTNAKRLQSNINQPPRKKIKLSKSIKVPLEDALSGVHTRLCMQSCTYRHNPLVLAVGVSKDCKFRTCLENHFKLSIKNDWKSSATIQDSTSMLRQLLVNLAVLFGKCDLLEFMLKFHLGKLDHFKNSAQGSPLFTVLRNIHLFMPSSSFEDKVDAFQRLLQLLVKYDSSTLLVQDVDLKETILHAFAKKIRDLTKEIRDAESSNTGISQFHELLTKRRLYEQFCSEIINTFQRLCVEGPFHQSQVLEFFDCKNVSGETMSDILQQEKAMRSERNVGSQAVSTVLDESNQDVQEQIPVDSQQGGGKDVEEALTLKAVTETPVLSQSNNLQSSCHSVQSVCVSRNATVTPSVPTLSTSSTSSQRPSGRAMPSTASVSMSSRSQIADLEVYFTSADYMDSPTSETSSGTGSKGNHSSLCNPGCSVKHHELIQLLCATADHDIILTPVAERESCSRFRNYLKKTSWDLNAVVFDPMPRLCYSIIHLACLLGKHRALEVLSEFGFHPLIHTSITEETPLHMTVRLLANQPTGSLFLCESVVSIFKILNRYSHAISLLLAKDYKGNTVLHSLANLFSPKRLVPELTALVYLFRVFVHFLLRGQKSSPADAHQVLSSVLSDCNKKGETVEKILRRSAVGEGVWQYLTGLMGGSVEGDCSEDHDVTQGKVLDQTERSDGTEDKQSTSSSSMNCTTECSPHTNTDEPESLVDFVLSGQLPGSSSADQRMLVERYCKEYKKRLRFLQQKAQLLQRELKCDNKEFRERQIMKASIEWNQARRQSAIDERLQYEKRESINNERILLLEELEQDLLQWENDHPGNERFSF